MELRTTMDEATRKGVADQLQPLLVDLVDLALAGKQAHWTVTGENFRSVHLQLDEIVDTARLVGDDIAERLATIGMVPDGRSRSVADGTRLEQLDLGWMDDTAAVSAIASRMQALAGSAREAVRSLDDLDLVSQDMVIGLVAALEKHLWMLSAQE